MKTSAFLVLTWVLAGIIFILMTLPGMAGSPPPSPAPFDLTRLDKELSLSDSMEYLPDIEGRHSLGTALQSKDWRPLPVSKLGYLGHPVWTRLRVSNPGDTLLTAILFNQRPVIQYMDISVLDKDRLLSQQSLGFMNADLPPNFIIHRLANINLHVPPGAIWTIITRLQTPGMTEAAWWASTVSLFTSKSFKHFFILGLFCGIMASLVSYGVASWHATGQVQFLNFVGYAISFWVFVLIVNGLTRIIAIGIPPIAWICADFALVCSSFVWWIRFSQFFLNTKTTMPIVHFILNWILGIFIAGFTSYILGGWYPEVFLLTPIWSWLGTITYFFAIFVGILAVLRNIKYAWLFLVGHAATFAVSGLCMIIGQTNLIHNFSSILPLHLLAVIIQTAVMALSLGMFARRSRITLARERHHALDQSRFTAIGQTVGMIVHQWRTPLARLGTLLTEMNAYFLSSDNFKEHEARIRNDLLPAMEQSMQQLTGSVDDFSDFFAAKRPMNDFDPERIITRVQEMVDGRCRRLGVVVHRQTPASPLSVHSCSSTLTHILLVLLENALDALEEHDISAPKISIYIKKEKREVAILVEDNGGGITIFPVDTIFDSFISEKGGGHMGLGLGLAQKLVHDRLKGTIQAENIENGSRFIVRIPLE